MDIKKRFKLRKTIIGLWINVEPFCQKSMKKGCCVMINETLYRVVKTRHCGIKIVEYEK